MNLKKELQSRTCEQENKINHLPFLSAIRRFFASRTLTCTIAIGGDLLST
jgi:hypothetical protein